jgi:hypothetical protein
MLHERHCSRKALKYNLTGKADRSSLQAAPFGIRFRLTLIGTVFYYDDFPMQNLPEYLGAGLDCSPLFSSSPMRSPIAKPFKFKLFGDRVTKHQSMLSFTKLCQGVKSRQKYLAYACYLMRIDRIS